MVSTIKRTLIDMVQEILSDLDADNVNSINDTDEATQVARIVQNTYFDLVANRLIPEHKELTLLDSVGDNTRPTYLKLPSDVSDLITFEYNVSTDVSDVSFREIKYCTPEEFLRRIRTRDNSDTNTTTMLDINGNTTLIIRNNRMPSYFTSFDDLHIVCDSYDSDIDTTLQASKTRAYVSKIPQFDLIDTASPDIDDSHIRFLINEAKSSAIAILHKQVNPKVENTARRQRVFSQNDKHRLNAGNNRNNYGRS